MIFFGMFYNSLRANFRRLNSKNTKNIRKSRLTSSTTRFDRKFPNLHVRRRNTQVFVFAVVKREMKKQLFFKLSKKHLLTRFNKAQLLKLSMRKFVVNLEETFCLQEKWEELNGCQKGLSARSVTLLRLSTVKFQNFLLEFLFIIKYLIL